jgi:hypothetical protein
MYFLWPDQTDSSTYRASLGLCRYQVWIQSRSPHDTRDLFEVVGVHTNYLIRYVFPEELRRHDLLAGSYHVFAMLARVYIYDVLDGRRPQQVQERLTLCPRTPDNNPATFALQP